MKHTPIEDIRPSNRAAFLKAVADLPQKLQEIHKGRIVLRETAVYEGRKVPKN